MPAIHQETFKIRHDECDYYGHLNQVAYLRYMQEAAYQASAAVGYDMVAYESTGRFWLVRETEVEFLQQTFYGDLLQVKTWVEDFRRVRSIRAYELTNAATGTMAARGWSDWVYLDRENLQPVTIPAEMVVAFMPEWQPGMKGTRRRFPVPAPAPPGVFGHTRRVEWRDLDPAQHVNNAVYLQYLEECNLALGRAFQWPFERMQQAGFSIYARRHQVEYRQLAFLGDVLEIITWICGLRHSSATRCYVIRRQADGAVLSQVQSMYVWLDTATGRPIRIPANFLADFAANISPEALP